MKKQAIITKRREKSILLLTTKLAGALDVPLRFSRADRTDSVSFDRSVRSNPFCRCLNRRREICRRCASACFRRGQGKRISMAATRFPCINGSVKLVTPVFANGLFCGVLSCGPMTIEKPTRECFQRMLGGLNQAIPPQDRQSLWGCYNRIPVFRAGKMKALTSLLPDLAGFLGARSFASSAPAKPLEHPESPVLVDRALQLIQSHGDGKISLKSTAQQLHVSAAHLSRKFHLLVGVPFHIYVARTHVEEAKVLIEYSSAKCVDVAFKAGFNSVAAFNRWFRKLTGKTPHEFRHSLKKTGNS
ncbi:MAG: helix-turn-helix domain-containing protein [Methylacidiphilales bacterium]|nr:helix-turn-helix domain-containing protein [Candidatus Methylacidiphilales bacterium]